MRVSFLLLAVFVTAWSHAYGGSELTLVYPTNLTELEPHDSLVFHSSVPLDPNLVSHEFSKENEPLWPFSKSVPWRFVDSQVLQRIQDVYSVALRDSLLLRHSRPYECSVRSEDTLVVSFRGLDRGRMFTALTFGIPFDTVDSTGTEYTAYTDQQSWSIRAHDPVSHIASVFPTSGPLYCNETVSIQFSNSNDLVTMGTNLDHGIVITQDNGGTNHVYVESVDIVESIRSVDVQLGGLAPGVSFTITLDPDVYSSLQNHNFALQYFVPEQGMLIVHPIVQQQDGALRHEKPDTLYFKQTDSAQISLAKPGHRIAKSEILTSPYQYELQETSVVLNAGCPAIDVTECEVLYVPQQTTTVVVPDIPQLNIQVLTQSGELIGGSGEYTYSDSPLVIAAAATNGYKFNGWDVVEEWGPLPEAIVTEKAQLAHLAKIGGHLQLHPDIEVVPPCDEYSFCIESIVLDNFLKNCVISGLEMPTDIVETNLVGCHTYPTNDLVGITAEIIPEYRDDYLIVGYRVNGHWIDFDPPSVSVSTKLRPGHCATQKNIEIVAIPRENVRVDVSAIVHRQGASKPGLQNDFQVLVYEQCTDGENLITSTSKGAEQTFYVAPSSTLRVEYYVADASTDYVDFVHWQYAPGFTHPYVSTPPEQPDVVSFEFQVKHHTSIQAVFEEKFHLIEVGFHREDQREEIDWFDIRDLTQDPIEDIEVMPIADYGMGTYMFLKFSHAPDAHSVLHGGVIVDEVSQRMDVDRYELGQLESYVFTDESTVMVHENMLTLPLVKRESTVDGLPTGIPKGERFRALIREVSTTHTDGSVESIDETVIVQGETEMPGLDIVFKGARVLEHSYDGDVELMHFYKASIVNAADIAEYALEGNWDDESLKIDNIGKLPHHCYDELDKDDYPIASYDETVLSTAKLDKSDLAFLHVLGLDYDNLDSQCDSVGFIEAAEDFYNGVMYDELNGPFEARYLMENVKLDSLLIEIKNEASTLDLFEAIALFVATVVILLVFEGFYQILMGWCPELMGDRAWAYGKDSWWGTHPSWGHQQQWVKSLDLKHDVEFKLRMED